MSEYRADARTFETCWHCHNESAVKVYHHGEYSWSDRFSIDQKQECNVFVCMRCGLVTLRGAKAVDE